MNIFSYDRVSGDDQRKEGKNIKIKKKKFLKLGVPEENIYADEAISGGFNELSEVKIRVTPEEFIVMFPIKKRPEFNRLIQKLNITPDSKLLFPKYDRLSRSSSFGDLFFIWLEQKKIQWQVLEDPDTHDAPSMRRFLFMWANDRRDNDASNIKSQRKNLYEDNKWAYRGLIGYKKPKDGRLEIDTEKSEMIKDIFNMTIEKKDYRQICEKWKIFPAQYYKIIKNKVYCGYIFFNNEWKKTDQVEQIISEEQWRKVNELKNNQSSSSSNA